MGNILTSLSKLRVTIEGFLKTICVDAPVIIKYVGITLCDHRSLRVPGVALNCFDVAAAELQLMINGSPYNGSGSLTREQFLFYEMRTTAKLKSEGLSNKEIIERIVRDNLFQYPTEKSVRSIANACIARLDALGDDSLVTAIASQPSQTAKQIWWYRKR